MTRTQFVESRRDCFWAYDVVLGIFLKHLIDAAEASAEADEPWLSKEVSWWPVVACVSTYGLTLDGDGRRLTGKPSSAWPNGHVKSSRHGSESRPRKSSVGLYEKT